MNEISLIIKPDAEEADAAEVLVDGAICGHTYRFLLDTGAAKSSIVYDDYTSTFSSTEKNSSSGVFAKSSEDLITVPSIAVGTIARENFTLVRMAENRSGSRNLIGMDFLKDFRCHFCFDENRVLVDVDNEATDSPFQDLFLDSRFHPYVDVQFNTAKASAVWDTGASLTIVDMSFVKLHPDFFQQSGQSTGTDSTGTEMETPMFTMAASRIGSQPFPPLKVAGVDLAHVNATLEMPMDLILGYNVLSQAHWLFDFPGKKWAITD